MSDVPLIPRELLFGNPDRTGVLLSPDGDKVSYLAPVDGVLNVWVGPADDWASAKPVTRETVRGIRIYDWAYTSDHILYSQDKDGDENWHVYCASVASGEIVDLTPYESVHAYVAHASHKAPSEILIGLNDRDPRLHDIHRVNIETGESTLVFQNESYASIVTDDDFAARLGVAFNERGGMDIVELADGEARPLMEIGPEDALTTGIEGFSASGDRLYYVDSRGRNTAALMAMDLGERETTLIAEDERVDILSIITHPTEKHPQAYGTTYLRHEWHVLDPAVQADLDYLGTVAEGELHILDRTLDDTRWLVSYVVDNDSTRYFRYDRQAGRAEFLFVGRDDLVGQPLARMHPVVIRSRDGLDLISYLTLPVSADPQSTGRPAEPVPMVLWVHGGPWGRDTWGLDPVHQWLANRGYAVLSVNFRASTGFGKAFVNAGNREWAAAAHDDLIDAVDWAVAEGIADRDRVAIGGGSYGGYATLVGVTFTPEVFACGVDIVGPSNLVTLLENLPDYWLPMLPVMTDRVGDTSTEEGRAFLLERSPLTHVDRICRPLLIGQGANDPRVKQQESDQIVAAMEEKGIPVAYVLYADEGHGFARPENRISFFAVMEAFLAEHLGGRYEPIGDSFEGASIEAKAGADGVPGLVEALGQ